MSTEKKRIKCKRQLSQLKIIVKLYKCNIINCVCVYSHAMILITFDSCEMRKLCMNSITVRCGEMGKGVRKMCCAHFISIASAHGYGTYRVTFIVKYPFSIVQWIMLSSSNQNHFSHLI